MTDADNDRQRRESIEHIAERAAQKAVRETLMLIGVDVRDPIKAQEQFAKLRSLADTLGSERTQANLEWLDRWHIASDRVADAGWRTVARLVVTAGLGLLFIGTSEYWSKHIPWPFK